MNETEQVIQRPVTLRMRDVRPRLGIIGGGQLAKMTAASALKLGCDVTVLERNAHSPAGNMAARLIVGDWDDPAVLRQLAEAVDVVTLENEFVSADSLAAIEAAGATLFPSSRSLRLVQDKMQQKQACVDAGLAIAGWCSADTPANVLQAGDTLGWPLLLKARRNAYDGKGNVTIDDRSQVDSAWARLSRGGPLYVEAFCPFVKELAVIVTRDRHGATVVYPVVESIQNHHVCHMVHAPAAIPESSARQAAELARRLVESIEGVGSFGVEMFLLADGRVVINEISPRVHNSGHYTIEACVCSQFENHVRAVMGWPLGSPRLVAPACTMVNLLGQRMAGGVPHGLADALRVDRASIHLYGKLTSQPGRKMGHITALGATIGESLDTAMAAASHIHFGDPA